MKPWSRLAQSWGMNRLKRNSKTESWKTKAFAADTEVSKQKEYCLTSDYTTKPQSSRQCGIGTKTDIQINGSEQKAQR